MPLKQSMRAGRLPTLNGASSASASCSNGSSPARDRRRLALSFVFLSAASAFLRSFSASSAIFVAASNAATCRGCGKIAQPGARYPLSVILHYCVFLRRLRPLADGGNCGTMPHLGDAPYER